MEVVREAGHGCGALEGGSRGGAGRFRPWRILGCEDGWLSGGEIMGDGGGGESLVKTDG